VALLGAFWGEGAVGLLLLCFVVGLPIFDQEDLRNSLHYVSLLNGIWTFDVTFSVGWAVRFFVNGPPRDVRNSTCGLSERR
jgi:hypothetical protein